MRHSTRRCSRFHIRGIDLRRTFLAKSFSPSARNFERFSLTHVYVARSSRSTRKGEREGGRAATLIGLKNKRTSTSHHRRLNPYRSMLVNILSKYREFSNRAYAVPFPLERGKMQRRGGSSERAMALVPNAARLSNEARSLAPSSLPSHLPSCRPRPPLAAFSHSPRHRSPRARE